MEVELKEISSLQHPIVKHLVKLRDKKEYRSHCQTVLISGVKLIHELSLTHRFKTVLIEKNYKPLFRIESEDKRIVTAAILKKVTGLAQPEPIAAEIALPEEKDLSHKRYLLILDGISDPGNMGTLLRTALALGWEGVWITPGSTDPFNEKALRAAKGATFKIPLSMGSWEKLEQLFHNEKWTILAADVDGKTMSGVTAKPPLALALGNEASGLSAYIKSHAHQIAIPMENDTESLNVACAGAILMHYLRTR